MALPSEEDDLFTAAVKGWAEYQLLSRGRYLARMVEKGTANAWDKEQLGILRAEWRRRYPKAPAPPPGT